MRTVTWTKEDAIEQLPPVPVQVDGVWDITHGKIVVEGNNPWVVAYKDRQCYEERFSWEAVLQALNERDCRLPLALPRRRFVTPALLENNLTS